MKITQLSVFAENKPGYVITPCRRLADADIEIRALSLAETARFGVLRLIVSDSHKASKLLEEAGFLVKTNEVLAVEVPEGPRGLSQVLAAVENSALNIDYMYAMSFGNGGKAMLVLQFADLDAAIERLRAAGLHLVPPAEVQAD